MQRIDPVLYLWVLTHRKTQNAKRKRQNAKGKTQNALGKKQKTLYFLELQKFFIVL